MWTRRTVSVVYTFRCFGEGRAEGRGIDRKGVRRRGSSGSNYRKTRHLNERPRHHCFSTNANAFSLSPSQRNAPAKAATAPRPSSTKCRYGARTSP